MRGTSSSKPRDTPCCCSPALGAAAAAALSGASVVLWECSNAASILRPHSMYVRDAGWHLMKKNTYHALANYHSHRVQDNAMSGDVLMRASPAPPVGVLEYFPLSGIKQRSNTHGRVV